MNLDQKRKASLKAWHALETGKRPVVFIGAATCGLAAGAGEIMQQVLEFSKKRKAEIELVPVGCMGLCFLEPMVDVYFPGLPRISYGQVTAEKMAQILDLHVQQGKPVTQLALGVHGEKPIDGIGRLSDLPFMQPQARVVLRNCGVIDPENFYHYLARGGYLGLERALSMKPEAVIEEVMASGLRGRGGGGFPTGQKWKFCREAKGEPKYIICNADEGDPGAFMNRSLLESDPHSMLEGLCIAAWAIGASHGYIYIRAEYPLAVKRLRHSLEQMKEAGLLGKNCLGNSFGLDITIKEGAGAFVCGEETALIASIEGQRGMPRPRPPFPAQKGLFGQPTTINNVETLALVGHILREGAGWFTGFGTEKNRGTKTFALAGKINHPGLIEVPLGIDLRQVVEKIGGGIPGGKSFKAAQTGGPSGGCLPSDILDTPIDYEQLTRAGSIMGSGGLVIMDEATCMVDVARYFLAFTQNESCGKCTPCRVGTREMLDILELICSGKGEEKHLTLLEELGVAVKSASLCGLGQTAPNPVLTTIRYFREEYLEHIRERKCRAKVCRPLLRFSVIAENCTGCMLCKKRCPAGAISGEKKQVHLIDQSKCTKCGVCQESCRFGAILVE